MKRILTLSLLLLASASLHAQTLKRQKKSLTDVERFQQHILMKAQRTSAAAKTTVPLQRVTGESGYDINGTMLTLSDTTNFKYSSGRGSMFNYNELYHNYYFPGNTDPGLDPFTFGVINTLADTVRYYSVDTALHIQEEVYAQYTPANKLMSYTYLSNWQERVINSYDAQGRLYRMVGFGYNASTQQWDSAYIRNIQYNSQHEVISDTLFMYSAGDWLPRQVVLYTYTAGKLTSGLVKIDQNLSGSLVDLYSTALTYYLNNNIKDIVIELNQGNGLMPVQRDSFAHDPQSLYRTYHQTWIYNSVDSSFIPYNLVTRNVNSAGIPDTTRLYSWNQQGNIFDEQGFFAAQYNSYNNPVWINFFSLNATTYTNDYRYFFFYEEYDPTSISQVAEQEQMSVYPNPAQNVVNIKWKADGKKAHINIMNAAGQMMHSEGIDRVKGTEQVNISHLSSGIYWLNVTNASGQVIFKTSVLKQ